MDCEKVHILSIINVCGTEKFYIGAGILSRGRLLDVVLNKHNKRNMVVIYRFLAEAIDKSSRRIQNDPRPQVNP